MSEQTAIAAPAPKWRWLATVAAFLTAALLSVLGSRIPVMALTATRPANDPVTNGDLLLAVVAYACGVATAVWSVVYIVYRRRNRLSFGVGQLLAICVAVMALDGVIAFQGSSDADAANAEERAALAAQESGAPIDMTVHARGDAGIVAGAYKRFLARQSENNRGYRAELHDLGFPAILSAASLGTGDLSEVAEKLNASRKVITKYSALSDANSAAYRAEIANSAMAPASKALALRNFDTVAAVDLQRRRQFWADEFQKVDLYVQNVALLQHNRGSWRYQGGAIRWASPELLATFNARVRASAALTAADAAADQKARDAERAKLAPPPT